MAVRPTKKQYELLTFIDGFIKGNGYSPSFREIMRALDYRSVSTVATHVNGLIARGWLIKRDNAARTLEVMIPLSQSDTTTSAMLVSLPKNTPVASAEQEIRDKLDELLGIDNEQNREAIDALRLTLKLLGYENSPGGRIV